MKNYLNRALTVSALTFLGISAHAACLTTSATPVGAPIFGATVGTFVGLLIDPNVTCIENALWTNPANFGLGTYVKGAEAWGQGIDNTALGSYNLNGSAAVNADSLDHAWVQDNSANANPGNTAGSGPSQGAIWDLGGQANQAAVFVFVDHLPVPGEVLENTVWLSNDPNAADVGWTQASLAHVYADGWDPNLAVISDGFVAVYQLAGGATFRYVSVTWGGPGAILRDGDNEIDAVGGLTQAGTGVGSVPEPASVLLLGTVFAIAGGALRRRRAAKA